ncbi:hypothetical protein ABFW14_34465 [Mycolicibacterium fortuitum]|uniref:hypothetical protein n=1 Tax=Mycobacteriaceae TaxID=1762 RepID=UPI0034D01231
MGAQDYVAQIDRLLAAAGAVFPDPSQRPELPAWEGPTLEPPPDGGGGLAERATESADTYNRMVSEAATQDAAVRETLAAMIDAVQRGSRDMEALRDAARTQAAAILPEKSDGKAPEELKLLTETMDERLGAAQTVIASTRVALEQAAQRLRAITST